jgi:hypothetical protein
VAKAAIRNDRRTKSNPDTHCHTYAISNPDCDTYSYADAQCDADSYTNTYTYTYTCRNPDSHAYADCNGKSSTKACADTKISPDSAAAPRPTLIINVSYENQTTRFHCLC